MHIRCPGASEPQLCLGFEVAKEKHGSSQRSEVRHALRMISTLPSVQEKIDGAQEKIDGAQEMMGGEEPGWMGLLGLCRKLEASFLDWFESTLSQSGPTNLDWCWRRDAHVVRSSSSRPGPCCRIPELVRCTPLSPLLVLHDAPLRILHHRSLASWARCCRGSFVIDQSSRQPPSLYYGTTAHAFARKVRYSVLYCLHPAHGIIGIRFIMLAPGIARKNFTSCGDEEAK